MRRILWGILLLSFCSILSAQQATQQTIDTAAVVKLQNAGVSDAVIIGMINASPCNFDTSTDGVIALKNAGVHDAVALAIINRMNALAHPRPAYIAPPLPEQFDSDDPQAPHEAGVYLIADSAGAKPQMLFIDRVGESAVKVSNLMGAAFSFGAAKMKLKADIPGPHATVRTTASRPVFYMYFPDTGSLGAFSGVAMVTSPNQFSLLALDQQKQDRETVIASMGIAGGTMGADPKKTVPFTAGRIRPGVYKVTPSADLKPGEYAFIAVMPGVTPETPPNTVVYDFGVDAKTP
jgi:hypothetical protein